MENSNIPSNIEDNKNLLIKRFEELSKINNLNIMDEIAMPGVATPINNPEIESK